MANSVEGKVFCYMLVFAIVFLCYSSVLACLEPDPIRNVPSVTEINSLDDLSLRQSQLEKLEELVMNLSRLVSRLESELEAVSDAKTVEMNAGAVSVTKHNPFWSERFEFVSAVKLHSKATSISILPFRDFDGLSKYIAVGDEHGRVYVILRNGDVLIDFDTKADSSVTSMLSYSTVAKNESVLITGHKNGMILVHRVLEDSNMDEWSSSLTMNNTGKFDDSLIEINTLDLHYAGRMRYIVSTDTNGTIRVFRENGTIYGLAFLKSKPLAILKQRLMFLTKTGVGSLDLRSMKIRENVCEGLDNYSAISYTFDTLDRSKAYGITIDGDLIHVMLLGDAVNFKCRARVFKRKFNMTCPQIALQTIRGYLLVVNHDNVLVYNVSSSHHYARSVGLGPRLILVATINQIRYSFPHSESKPTTNSIPLASSDREKLVVLSLGNGYIGAFRSKLPVYKPEPNSILWTSPVFFFILFLFGAWHFFAKKKDALISWGPDEPLTLSPINRDSPSSSSLDGGVSLRRYNSPPRRYGNEMSSSYRATSGDGGGPIDARASELKYRGTNRRDNNLFGHDNNGMNFEG